MELDAILAMLCHAIEGRLQVSLSFDQGSGPGQRICQPYMVYETSTGRLMLEAFQLSGDSARALPSWKSLELRSIRVVQLREETFDPVSSWNPSNRERYVLPICSIPIDDHPRASPFG